MSTPPPEYFTRCEDCGAGLREDLTCEDGCDDPEWWDPSPPMRFFAGVIMGGILSIPLWTLIAYVVQRLWAH